MMKHTAEEAIGRFELIAGSGNGETTACAMSALAWMHGETKWTDRPKCANQVLASNVIRANDAAGTDGEYRAKLVRAGVAGVINTWWIPDAVVCQAISDCRGDMIGALRWVADWKEGPKELPPSGLVGANLCGVELRAGNLRGVNLREANLRGAHMDGANLRMADLTGADVAYASWSDVDLTGASRSSEDPPIPGWHLNRGHLRRRRRGMDQ